MGEGGVNFGLEEGEEEIEEVYSEGVADCGGTVVSDPVGFWGVFVVACDHKNLVERVVIGRRWRLTYVPSLREYYAEEEESEEDPCSDPSVGSIWCAFVKIGLV